MSGKFFSPHMNLASLYLPADIAFIFTIWTILVIMQVWTLVLQTRSPGPWRVLFVCTDSTPNHLIVLLNHKTFAFPLTSDSLCWRRTISRAFMLFGTHVTAFICIHDTLWDSVWRMNHHHRGFLRFHGLQYSFLGALLWLNAIDVIST